MRITIEEYDPAWKYMFMEEKGKLIGLFNELLIKSTIQIEHIGSTAVEGLGAKPVIDIMIGLDIFSETNLLIPSIETAGYTYIPQFENEMPYRRFFIKERENVRTHHIHMVEVNTGFWNRHLAFRDHLRKTEKDRNAYHQLKKELAEKEWEDGGEYARAKTSFIRSIEQKAMM